MPNQPENPKGEGPKNPVRAAALPASLQAYMNDLDEQRESCEGALDDHDLGRTSVENAADHLRDIQWYEGEIRKYLPKALLAVHPERNMPNIVAAQSPFYLGNSISTVLETFERYRGRRLLRPTAWHYNASFLNALGQTRDEMLGLIILRNIRKLSCDPLAALARDISVGLEASEANVTFADKIRRTPDVDERSTKHTFTICIANSPDLVIASSDDVLGFKNAIWGELVIASGNNLTWEILAHGWKYSPHPATGAKRG